MEKTLTIDGREVRFKSTAATSIRYKAQFQSDFFADLLKMHALTKLNLDSEEINYDMLRHFDTEVLYNLFWVMAKTADKSIPDPMTWLDEFDEFPVFEIFDELQELIMKNLQTTKKK